MILQKHWTQEVSLSKLTDSFFEEELTPMLDEFISSERYKQYYTNHIVVEKYKNVARLFNKNTEEYIGIGFFKTKENEDKGLVQSDDKREMDGGLL